ncbi:MAG: RAMP superfamily CRISPR-associated protein [Clostridiales Family XIII bacterium]|jgi:CRISPR-associated protein Csm3|nr:RAMP superfamily CRISPR-associated protein [Clostridiales Family XIII bacterium]
MQDTIKLKITTLSNLFIGGAPIPFEIGGIDQQTATDQEGFPCIPGSSFKGALRAVVRMDESDTRHKIEKLYEDYLDHESEKCICNIQKFVGEAESRKRIEENYIQAKKKLSPEYLFGIEGFNNTPKLLFSDLLLCEEYRDKKICFSVDMKNSIDSSGSAPVSNPRTYKAARSGLVFEGEIRLHNIGLFDGNANAICKKYLIHSLAQFNAGVYRLGNSKSRGYGKIKVEIIKGEIENDEG